MRAAWCDRALKGFREGVSVLDKLVKRALQFLADVFAGSSCRCHPDPPAILVVRSGYCFGFSPRELARPIDSRRRSIHGDDNGGIKFEIV